MIDTTRTLISKLKPLYVEHEDLLDALRALYNMAGCVERSRKGAVRTEVTTYHGEEDMPSTNVCNIHHEILGKALAEQIKYTKARLDQVEQSIRDASAQMVEDIDDLAEFDRAEKAYEESQSEGFFGGLVDDESDFEEQLRDYTEGALCTYCESGHMRQTDGGLVCDNTGCLDDQPRVEGDVS